MQHLARLLVGWLVVGISLHALVVVWFHTSNVDPYFVTEGGAVFVLLFWVASAMLVLGGATLIVFRQATSSLKAVQPRRQYLAGGALALCGLVTVFGIAAANSRVQSWQTLDPLFLLVMLALALVGAVLISVVTLWGG